MASPKVSRYCPICGNWILCQNGTMSHADYIVRGSGKFRRKQYYHPECLQAELNRFYRKEVSN